MTRPATAMMKCLFCQRRWLAVAVWAGCFWAGLTTRTVCQQIPPRPAASKPTVDYQRHIQPILAKHCLACHGPHTQESGFRLDRKAVVLQGGDLGQPAVIAGNSDDSLLIRAVAGLDETLVMPPEGPGLSAREITLLRAWIDQGLAWPEEHGGGAPQRLTTDHWSLQPLAVVEPPSIRHEWIANPIDAFVLARLEQHQLAPSAECDRRQLIRRLYLDMLGLPPSPQAVESFVADRHADAYQRLVDRVLSSPRYGERWAQHWLDVARFAETNGFETNTPRPTAYHYRDYVIRAWNEDKSYDRFVLEQLCGDAVGQDAATGFLVAGPYDTVKSPDVNLTLMQRQDELADMINATGTAFLGLTLACARCHNHKFDPVLQKDYYALQAVFAGVQHGERRLPQGREQQRQIERLQRRINELNQQLTKLTAPPEPRDAGQVLVIDDETPAVPAAVRLLAAASGHGVKAEGDGRGHSADPGDLQRLPNLGGGRYSWWQSQPGQDLMAYLPAVAGRFRIWLSWGSGRQTHARDARYVLDRDGNLQTADDQQPLATVDQRHFAKGSEAVAGTPLWSGLYDAGVHQLEAGSLILLRNGAARATVTADAIVLQQLADGSQGPDLPRLRPAVAAGGNEERFPATRAKYIRFTVLATNTSEPCLDELEIYAAQQGEAPQRNLALASSGARARSSGDFPDHPKHKLEHIHDGQYGNSHSWISNEVGRGWVQIELAQVEVIDRIRWARDRLNQYQDRLATRYRIEVAERPGGWRTVATSDDRLPLHVAGGEVLAYRFAGLTAEQRAQVRKLLPEKKQREEQLKTLTSAGAVAYAGRFESPPPTHRLYRGDPMQKREAVAPDALTVLGSLGLAADTPEQQRRVALARWITAADHPLTARVVANRVWHYHFGSGLVPTPSDFGGNGMPATHPQLLDWLARRLICSGWSIKQLQRLILTSSTYRQSSAPRAKGLAADAQCQLLWRFPPRRLEAEAIRDSMLLVSGALDLRMYGPGFDVFQPNSNYVRVYRPRQIWGPAQWRRMVYRHKVRMEHEPVFGSFDCPDAGQPAPRRSRSTTAIQALNLLNSSFVHQQSEIFAERLRSECGGQDARQLVQLGFRYALGRPADAQELGAALTLVRNHGLPALCRALFNANEFLFLP